VTIPQSIHHVVTPNEIEAVKKLGYTFNSGTILPENFINKHFANLDLLQWLEEIEKLFKPLKRKKLIKMIECAETRPLSLTIQYVSDDFEDDQTGLALSRILSFEGDDLVVTHDFFRLPTRARGKGIAKKLLSASIQQYVNMGVQRIRVHAALVDGGYVWALNFFEATEKEEVSAILENARHLLKPAQFKIAERIYTNYYSKYPEGRAFPMVKWAALDFMVGILRGSHWQGVIDLNNMEQFSNFIDHVDQIK
jgi:GNAT superfamily N-acetyltransferase